MLEVLAITAAILAWSFFVIRITLNICHEMLEEKIKAVDKNGVQLVHMICSILSEVPKDQYDRITDRLEKKHGIKLKTVYDFSKSRVVVDELGNVTFGDDQDS